VAVRVTLAGTHCHPAWLRGRPCPARKHLAYGHDGRTEAVAAAPANL